MMNNKSLQSILLILGILACTACKKTDPEASDIQSINALKSKNIAYLISDGLTTYNWMKNIPDTASISQLSIPGTHDSGANVDFSVGPVSFNNSSKCQNLTIPEQLEAGVRFLDIRCKRVGNSLKIYHDEVDQLLTFDQVSEYCLNFLNKNPSEMIIMCVKEEGNSISSTQSFNDIFIKNIQKDVNRWDLSAGIPKLGDIRGKIKLLRRFESNTALGIDASKWKDDITFEINNADSKLTIQDQYKTYAGSEKWNLMQSIFDLSKKEHLNRLYINYGTAYNIKANLSSAATKETSIFVNAKIVELFDGQVLGKYGIIPLDFIDGNLAARIISTNPLLKSVKKIEPKYQDGWNYALTYSKSMLDYDIWLPANRNKDKTRLFVFVHGGNFTNGDKRDTEYQETVNAIIKEFPDCAVATINYRTGISDIKAEIEDVETAVKEMVNKSGEMNISNQKIVLVGESAGAYLTFFEGLRDDVKDGNQERYKAIVSLNGFANMLPEMSESWWKNAAATGGLAFKLDPNLILKDLKRSVNIDTKPLGWIPDWVGPFSWLREREIKVDIDPQANYRTASKKWSPVQWIPEREKIPELYVFYGEDDKEIETTESRKIEEYVNRNRRSEVRSKIFIKKYPDQGHTMDGSTKADIAKILKEKIIF